MPLLVNERGLEPIVVQKANQFVSFRFRDVQLLDILNFLGEATSLDSFLKAYKTSETKGYFSYEWFDNPEKLDKILNFLLSKLSLANCATIIPLEKTK